MRPLGVGWYQTVVLLDSLQIVEMAPSSGQIPVMWAVSAELEGTGAV